MILNVAIVAWKPSIMRFTVRGIVVEPMALISAVEPAPNLNAGYVHR